MPPKSLTVTKIAVDGTKTTHEPKNGKRWLLEEIQGLLDGGYYQRLPPTLTRIKEPVVCDEEGMLKKLPVNPMASDLVGYPLVGPVLLFPAGYRV